MTFHNSALARLVPDGNYRAHDRGHWEEQRKVSASSIGTVVAGLEAFADLLRLRRSTRSFPAVRSTGGQQESPL